MSANARSRRTVRVSAAIGAAGLAAALSVGVPAAAFGTGTAAKGSTPAGASLTTAPTGWLRVAHLAPRVGRVDIYLSPRNGAAQIVLHNVSYGTFTTYQTLQPGAYVVAMRPVSAKATATPTAAWQLSVRAGTAYTVAAVGTPGHVQSEVFTDALVQPSRGDARVRLIQGAPAAGKVTVSAVDGPLLATGLTYGSITGYADVPQGRWTLKVTEDAKVTVTTVDVRAGGVYSLVVIQKADGALSLDTGMDSGGKAVAATGVGGRPVSMSVQMDAADSMSKPAGSVNTGEGGTAAGAPAAAGSAAGLAAGGLAASVAAGLAGLGVVALRRRGRVAAR